MTDYTLASFAHDENSTEGFNMISDVKTQMDDRMNNDNP